MRSGDPCPAGDFQDDRWVSPTVVVSAIRQWNSKLMMDQAVKVSSTCISPRTCSYAMRAEAAVPVSDRSIFPG